MQDLVDEAIVQSGILEEYSGFHSRAIATEEYFVDRFQREAISFDRTRVKEPLSTIRKALLYQYSIGMVRDVVAGTIVVPKRSDCYNALDELLFLEFEIAHKVIDTLYGAPDTKYDTDYHSLDVILRNPKGIIEVHIRTHELDEHNRRIHTDYKSEQSKRLNKFRFNDQHKLDDLLITYKKKLHALTTQYDVSNMSLYEMQRCLCNESDEFEKFDTFIPSRKLLKIIARHGITIP